MSRVRGLQSAELSLGRTAGAAVPTWCWPSAGSASPAVRRVWRGGCIYVDVQVLRHADLRGIAVSVGVVGRTTGRHIGPLRRLRELPNIGEVNATFSGDWRAFWKDAPWRRRAGIVCDPVDDFSGAGILADIACGNDVFTTFLLGRNTGTINAGAKSPCGHAIYPRVDVGFLLGQHAAALLLIEKDDRFRRKAFPARRGHSRVRIRLAQFICIGN